MKETPKHFGEEQRYEKSICCFCRRLLLPGGGWDDFVSFVDVPEHAVAIPRSIGTPGSKYDWVHVVDLEEGKIVRDFSSSDLGERFSIHIILP